MKNVAKLVAFFFVLLVGAFAQSDPSSEGNPAFAQAELDQMLAPIALYPDALLSQILMAATYPLEVVEAERWLQANSGLKGDAAVQAAASQQWDPSVTSLVAFPQVLETMDQKIDWTQRLGDAFLAQQSQVMDTIQSLRTKAQQAGNLTSNSQIDVKQNDGAIDIEPANPEVVYVPYYDPAAVYGTWWWPDYPPMFWAPWPDYGWDGGFAWGFGFGIGIDFFYGGWDWRHHHVFGGHPPGQQPSPWRHDPGHRHGVPYRNASLNQQFGRGVSPADGRQEFRGRPSPAVGPETRVAPTSRMEDRSPAAPNPHAFEDVGHGPDVRDYSARGHQSIQSAPARSAAPSGRRH
ncbi:MAG: DUF3300 domain-containing protein [Rudaea sp.]|nr:DUF3300 domain-containing protein [Rudaea sp.]